MSFLTELIPSCLVAAGFHYSAIALVGHLIKLHQLCFSGCCTLLPSLIPIVPEMRESGKFIAPPSHRPGFNINLLKNHTFNILFENLVLLLIILAPFVKELTKS